MQDPIQIIADAVGLILIDTTNSLQANGRYATGETVKSFEVVTTETAVQLLAAGYVNILEDGRGPTSPDAIPGDPPMIERIKAWCDAKGIDQKAAWAIKNKIDKEGYAGIEGVISEPTSEDNISRRLNPAINEIGNNIAQQVSDIFSQLELV
jgi:hypothetical protein